MGSILAKLSLMGVSAKILAASVAEVVRSLYKCIADAIQVLSKSLKMIMHRIGFDLLSTEEGLVSASVTKEGKLRIQSHSSNAHVEVDNSAIAIGHFRLLSRALTQLADSAERSQNQVLSEAELNEAKESATVANATANALLKALPPAPEEA